MIYSTSFGIIGRIHQTIYFVINSREGIQFTYAGDGCLKTIEHPTGTPYVNTELGSAMLKWPSHAQSEDHDRFDDIGTPRYYAEIVFSST